MNLLLGIALWVVVFEASSKPAKLMAPQESTAVKKTIAKCKRLLGPVAVGTAGGATAFAFGCERLDTSEVFVFARLPSGDFTTQCEKLTMRGEIAGLDAATISGRDLLWARTRLRTPDEEHDYEQVIAVRWGRCKTIAASDIKHDLEMTALGEPLSGITFDADGFDVWQDVVRLKFGEPQRVVATAMRGKRFSLEGTEWVSAPIESFAHEPLEIQSNVRWPVTIKAGKPLLIELAEPQAVRGIRVTARSPSAKQTLRAQLAGQAVVAVEWKLAEKKWTFGPGIFGAGFLGRSVAEQLQEAVVFFEPLQNASGVTLTIDTGSLQIEKVQAFGDNSDWALFVETE